MTPPTKPDCRDAPCTAPARPLAVQIPSPGRDAAVSPATIPVMPGSRRHDAAAQGHAPLPPRIIVTIDGPAGTGKSSTARALARRLGVDFLDTGAMYRAAAAIVLDNRLDPADVVAVVGRVREANLRFDWRADPPELLADGRSIMHRLREADVAALVSPLAGMTELRRLMVDLQQQIGREHARLVTEGRDQGSVVFPQADVKIYLDADPAVRAARRADQLRRSGLRADESTQAREITERDRSDSSRAEGPLICPQGAIRVDTTTSTFDQVVDRLEALVRQAVAARGRA